MAFAAAQRCRYFAMVTALAPYGQKYVDQLAAAYLASNDKDDLPMILTEIVASARKR